MIFNQNMIIFCKQCNILLVQPFYGPWILSGTTRVSRYQKGKTNQEGKTNLDLQEQEIVSGSGISCAMCKSVPRHRQITTPESHCSVFYTSCRPTNSNHSTEGKKQCNMKLWNVHSVHNTIEENTTILVWMHWRGHASEKLTSVHFSIC